MITIKEEFVGCLKWKCAIKLGGADTILLWLAMKRYAAEKLTDGFVPDDAIEMLPGAPDAPRDALRALVECGSVDRNGVRGAGLVDPAGDLGWQLHNYLRHANSAEQEEERRRKARERKANWRAGRDSPAVSHGTSHGTDGVRSSAPARVRAHAPNPTQPNPTRKTAAAEDDKPVPCPPDLKLTEAQRQSLITGGIPESVFEQIETGFRAGFAATPNDLRPMSAWLKCLSQKVAGTWRAVYEQQKRGTEHGTQRGTSRLVRNGPRQSNTLDHLSDEDHAAAMGATLE